MFSWGNKQVPINGPGDHIPPTRPAPDPPRDDDESGTDPDGDRDEPGDDRDTDSDADKLGALMASSEATAETCQLITLSTTIARLIELSGAHYWRKDTKNTLKLFSKAAKTTQEFTQTCANLRKNWQQSAVPFQLMTVFQSRWARPKTLALASWVL